MYITAILSLLLLLGIIAFSTNKERKLRDFNLDNTRPLRGLLAILIVCHHISFKSNAHLPYLNDFFISIGMPIVAIFFMVSGYGLFVSYKKKQEKYLDGFLRKRYSKILPAFILLSIIAIAVWYLYGMSLYDQARSYVHGGTPLPHSWFIYAIVYVYAVFYVSAIIGKNLMQTGLIFTFLLFLYVVIMIFVLRFPEWWFYTIACTSVGYFIGYFEERISLVLATHKKSLLICSIIAIILLSSSITRVRHIGGVISMFWLMSVALCTYLAIRCLGMKKSAALVFLGDISMEIYLVHGLVILSLSKHIPSLGGIAFYIVAVALSICLAWLIHRLQMGKAK